MEKEVRKKKILLPIIALFFLLLIVIGVSYAVFTFVGVGVKDNTITSGSVTIVYTEGNELHIENAMPIDDETGKTLTGAGNVFDFTVQANLGGSSVISYEIAAIKKDTSTLKDEEIKIYLEKNESEILSPTHFIPMDETTIIGSPEGSMIIDQGVFTTSTTNYYIMKMWVDEDTEITDKVKTYTITVNVYAKDILMGTGPAPEECYAFDSSTGTITGYNCGLDSNSMKYYSVAEIPSQIDGVDVKEIGNAAFMGKQLKSVVIPEGITTIKNHAFRDNLLTNIELPSTITNMGYSLFVNNQLPDEEAFIYNRNADGSINYSSLNSYGGKERENVIIPSNITNIGTYAFGSVGLVSVVIPDSVTTIGIGAFECNQLTSVSIPTSVISMGSYAFVDNQFPDEEAFIYNRNTDGSINYSSLNSYGGKERENVVIPDNVTDIGAYAFFINQLTNIVIPNTVTNIGRGAFESNQLMSITIPESVISIGHGVFIDNPNLVKIVNKTGNAFDWNNIITSTTGTPFITGTVGGISITES